MLRNVGVRSPTRGPQRASRLGVGRLESPDCRDCCARASDTRPARVFHRRSRALSNSQVLSVGAADRDGSACSKSRTYADCDFAQSLWQE